jgi:hypothetical protein
VSATFAEPYFSRPQDAVVNAAGATGVFFAVQREPVEFLWIVLLVCAAGVFFAGVVATILPDGPSFLKWLAFRLSSKIGRAVVLGSTSLLLVTLTKAAAEENRFEYLATATAILAASLSIDWST